MSKFVDGLKFGLGFGVAFLALTYFGVGMIFDRSISEEGAFLSSRINMPDEGFVPSDSTVLPSNDNRELVNFDDLSIEDQIKYSSAIALAEFQASDDGKMRAIITDILKKEEDVKLYYAVGDEHKSSSFYPKGQVRHGNGLVIFFEGSPATMRMSMTYHGDRIRGLGDMPIKLFKEKCDASST